MMVVSPEFLHGDCEGCTAEGQISCSQCGCLAIRYLVAIFACFIGNGSELTTKPYRVLAPSHVARKLTGPRLFSVYTVAMLGLVVGLIMSGGATC